MKVKLFASLLTLVCNSPFHTCTQYLILCLIIYTGLSSIAYNPSSGEAELSDEYLGTLYYMAPEVLLWGLKERNLKRYYGDVYPNLRKYTPKKAKMYCPMTADVWSMGVILHEMLYYPDLPFDYKDDDKLYHKDYNNDDEDSKALLHAIGKMKLNAWDCKGFTV